jgi:hypothetical protein
MNNMKKIIFFLVIAQSNILFSQSKKEQIQILSLRIDSLEGVLENERSSYSLKIKELELAIINFESQTNTLKTEITECSNKLGQLKTDLSLMLSENGNLKVQLSNKSDSLRLIYNQLYPTLPENNFDLLITKFRVSGRDVSEQIKWIEEKVNSYNNEISIIDTSYFTKRCLEYVNAVRDNYWAAGDDEEEVHKRWNQDTIKWTTFYDLKYSPTGGLFSFGESTPKHIKVEYLGELNNGDWFKLTIDGEYIRILKLIKTRGRLYIDNLMNLTGY